MRPSAPAPTRWRRRRAIRSAPPSRRHGPSRAGCTRSLQARDRRPLPRVAPLRRSRAASPWHVPRGCRAAARRRRRRRPAAPATGGRPCVSRGRGAGPAGRPAARAACACVRRAVRARCATCVENKSGLAVGQLALRRLRSVPERAPGCPRLRPASANPPLWPRWPAIQALLS
eukprot:scaffold43992_cov69-Phaeocystis_antarctica.AAC.1